MIYVLTGVAVFLLFKMYSMQGEITDLKDEITGYRRQALVDGMHTRNSIEQLYSNLADLRIINRHNH